MKSLFTATLAFALTASVAHAHTSRHDYPSCDIKAQHALKGEMGGSIRDAGQAHISQRANILEADLGNARKAGRISQAQSQSLYKRVEAIRASANNRVKTHGSLSATVRAHSDRQLDVVAATICRP